MKFFLLVGGICGFLLAFVSSLYAGKDLSIVIRNSAFWCLVGGVVMKLCYKLLARFIRDAALAKARAMENAEQAEKGDVSRTGPQATPTK